MTVRRMERPAWPKDFAEKIADLRVLSNGVNRGKGFSVRHGSLQAKGEIVLFTDADLSAPIEEAEKLLGAMKNLRRGHRFAGNEPQIDRSAAVVVSGICRDPIQQDCENHPAAARSWIHNADSKLSAESGAELFLNSKRSNDLVSIRNCCTSRAIMD